MEEFLDTVIRMVESGDISMSELSRKSGVARPYLYRMLEGQHKPSLDVAEKVASALGLKFTLSQKTA